MKKTVIVLGGLCAFFAGISTASLMKKEKVIFVHKQCDEGKCISYDDLHLVKNYIKYIDELANQAGNEGIISETSKINKVLNK